MQIIIARDSKHVSYNTVKEFEQVIKEFTSWEFRKELNAPIKKIANKFFKSLIFFYPAYKSNETYLIILLGIYFIQQAYPYFLLKSCRKAVYLFDSWEGDLKKIAQYIDKLNLNYVFISAKQSYEHLSNCNLKAKLFWVPEGINTSDYHFLPYSEKTIDVLQIGRKYDLYHEKIVEFCSERQYKYLYEVKRGSIIFSTNEEFFEGLAKAKISVCVPSNITHPERSGKISTMTHRYLQSMASKCLILGICPDEMIELFDYNPVIEIDMENSSKQLEDILSDYDNYIPLIEKNYKVVKEHHQWKNRLDDIRKILSS